MNVIDRIKPKPKEAKDKKPKVKAKKSEANELTKAVMNYIALNGGYPMRINTQGQYDTKLKTYRKSGSTKGVSDIIFCYKGLFVAVEIKVGRDKLNDNQLDFKANLEKAKGIFYECRSIESFILFFKQLKEQTL